MLHLIRVLEEDHQQIRKICDELEKACEGSPENRDQGFCWDNFLLLKRTFTSHAEALEAAVFDLFDDEASSPERQSLRALSLQGYEEHALLNQIFSEMMEHRHIDDVWKAKLTVLSELLDHHFVEQKENYIPKVRNAMDDDQLREIAAIYSTERDELLDTLEESDGQQTLTVEKSPSHAHP